jgi:uncharacterized protein (DUF305 family)
MTATRDDLEVPAAAPVDARRSRSSVVLLAIIAAAVLVIAVAAGYVWGSRGNSSAGLPAPSSVDAGFARDMATHHQQAITMATYAEHDSTSTEIKALAYDIESGQSVQMGEMIGWLDTWGISRNYGTPMDWFPGHHHLGVGGLMPGMATPDQMNKLMSLHGKALDILFLQLMIRHHQGGVPMAQYAQQHAKEPYVRSLAQSILGDQQPQVIQMEQLLRQLGGKPLPPPEF